jgi:CheY-like chemotaxis protein
MLDNNFHSNSFPKASRLVQMRQTRQSPSQEKSPRRTQSSCKKFQTVALSAIIRNLNVAPESCTIDISAFLSTFTDLQTRVSAPILLIDDSELDAQAIRRAFVEAYSEDPIHSLTSCRDAMDYLCGEGRYSNREHFPLPCALILNLQMPNESAFDFLEWLQPCSIFKKLIIFTLTTTFIAKDIKRACDLGAQFFLVKPLKPEDLHYLIRSIQDLAE